MTESQLEQWLSEPSPELTRAITQYESPLIVLGAGGKMGPSLCILAQRAAEAAGHSLKVAAVSRFSDSASRKSLEAAGITTIPCDLFDARALARLPDSKNVVYLVGQKFGTSQSPCATWAVNTLIPSRVCERYKDGRIVALSTGNVYPLSQVQRGGSVETDPLSPTGEYPNAAVARERIFEFHSQQNGTPVALLRLFYAVELRYGVLVDIAQRVYSGQPVNLENGYFNCIWQGDAAEQALRAIDLVSTPPAVFNLCRPEIFSVRDVAKRLATLLGREPRFEGTESATALLGNPAKLTAALGGPKHHADQMLQEIALWIQSGGRNLNKPTHFEVRDGRY